MNLKNFRRAVAALLMLAGPHSSVPALAAPTVILELRAGEDFQGDIQRVTYDREGVAWIATPRQLFRAEHGDVKLVDSSDDNERRLVLAPGGGRYAWLSHHLASFGLFTIELLALDRPDKAIAHVYNEDPPRGFDTLFFSGQGSLLVGVSPLDNREGSWGGFLYSFWSQDGMLEGSVTLDGIRLGIVDEQGESIALLGESDAAAFARDGTPLWTVAGHYREGALGSGGRIAVLNSAESIDEIRVIQYGRVTTIGMQSPVYDVAITPDGTRAVVATSGGKLSLIELSSCTDRACRTRQLPPLPILSSHHVTEVRFIDRDTLAVGVIQTVGAQPYASYFGCAVAVITTSGEVRFRRSIDLPRPATWSPELDVVYGRGEFTAFTRSMAIVVAVGN
jgi:hypothetical protein